MLKINKIKMILVENIVSERIKAIFSQKVYLSELLVGRKYEFQALHAALCPCLVEIMDST